MKLLVVAYRKSTTIRAVDLLNVDEKRIGRVVRCHRKLDGVDRLCRLSLEIAAAAERRTSATVRMNR